MFFFDPGAKVTIFSAPKISLRLRIQLRLCFNRAQLVELGLEKLPALKTDQAEARHEVREIQKNIMCAPH